MNVVSSTGDVLHHHHHHPLNVSVGGTDEDEGDMDSIAHDEEGRTRRYVHLSLMLLFSFYMP